MGLMIYTICLMVLLTVLWRISSVARYYIKFLIYMVTSMVAATAPIPLMLLRPRDPKNALIPAAILRFVARLIGLNYNVQGLENIVKNSGCVVLINHQSSLDVIVLAYLWPIMDNSTVISKKEVFYIQPFGLASWLWGTIFIDRVNAKGAKTQVNQTEEAITTRNSRILIFPEGTRHLGKKLLPFKKGAFHLAIEAQCPIQPVVVESYKFLGKHRFESADLTIKILPQIDTKGCTKDDLDSIISKTYNVMQENFDLISHNS